MIQRNITNTTTGGLAVAGVNWLVPDRGTMRVRTLLKQSQPDQALEPIGRGSFGTVYMAEQTAPVRRMVALKVLNPEMDWGHVIARFEVERQALRAGLPLEVATRQFAYGLRTENCKHPFAGIPENLIA